MSLVLLQVDPCVQVCQGVVVSCSLGALVTAYAPLPAYVPCSYRRSKKDTVFYILRVKEVWDGYRHVFANFFKKTAKATPRTGVLLLGF